ncbi:MAG TPA: anthranilate synthase component II [Microbacterium sp.]|nr:anthranilate synthase component II [Microbacterium sp.]
MTFRVLVVDNDDSFVFTLVDYLTQLGAHGEVVRSRDIPRAQVPGLFAGYDAALLSPGPGAPGDAGVCIPLVREAESDGTPLLGVCLGHQAIAEAFGGVVATATEPMHGKTSEVRHGQAGLFAGLPNPFTATRYHSLAVVEESFPDELEITARTDGGVIMAVSHRSAAIRGVQFHPESVLTEGGHRLLANWLADAGMPDALETAKGKHPLVGSG